MKEAIQRDGDFAPAHAALARAYINRRTDIAPQEAGILEPKAFAAVERALSLDSELAEAYLARGDLLWTPSHRFPHERAVREYRRALQRNANLDGAHEGLARIFAHVGFFEQALLYASQALDGNPSNGLAVHHRSEALLWSEKNEEALAVLTSIPQPVFPELVAAHTAWALVRLNKLEEARFRLQRASLDFPDDPSGVLAAMEALLLANDKPDEAELRIEQASKKQGFNPSHHTAYFVGCAYAQMRRSDKAVQYLKQAGDLGFPCYPLLERDPNLDPIRPSAGFQALLEDRRKQRTSLAAALFPAVEAD